MNHSEEGTLIKGFARSGYLDPETEFNGRRFGAASNVAWDSASTSEQGFSWGHTLGIAGGPGERQSILRRVGPS